MALGELYIHVYKYIYIYMLFIIIIIIIIICFLFFSCWVPELYPNSVENSLTVQLQWCKKSALKAKSFANLTIVSMRALHFTEGVVFIRVSNRHPIETDILH